MSVRAAIAAAVQTPGGSVTEFCTAAGISRQTYYRIGNRFLQEGAEGLIPRSRRPDKSPNRTPAEVEDDVVLARKQLAEEGWDNGAWSIQQRLSRLGRPAPKSFRWQPATATAGSEYSLRTPTGSWCTTTSLGCSPQPATG